MVWSILADALMVIHGAFVAWVVLGVAAVWRWPRLAWLHLPALAWGVGISAAGGVCPLTPLEVAWRLRAGEAGFAGGFIEHHLGAVLYPAGLTRGAQWAMAGVLAGVHGVVYALAWRRWRRARAGADAARPPP